MEINDRNREALLQKWQHEINRTFDVYSWSSGHDLAAWAELASQAKRIVEVGSYHGKSALVMHHANPEAEILCIDQPQDERCWEILCANTRGRGIQLFKGTTGDWLRSLRPGGFDLAMVDAGHGYQDVFSDIQNLLPHMAPGATICGHDWRTDMGDGVNRAVMAHFARERISTFENVWWVKLP